MEKWKDVLNYEGFYEVSNLGRVRSRKVKILKQNLKKNGYLAVDLAKHGTVKTVSVHRIVALAFVDKLEGKDQVNHKNGNKLDNRAENLEWVTSQENRIHAFKTGLQKGRGKKIRCNQLDMVFDSSYKAAEYINDNYYKNSKQVVNIAGKIRASANKIQKCAYGFTWDYV